MKQKVVDVIGVLPGGESVFGQYRRLRPTVRPQHAADRGDVGDMWGKVDHVPLDFSRNSL